MAKTPPAPPAMTPDPNDPRGGTMGSAAGGASDDDDGDEDGEVLLTVLKNSDGTYELIDGDEDGDDDDDAGQGAAGAAGGAADGAGSASGGPEGQTFDSKGALLKGILDLLNEDEDQGGSDFETGFAGGSSASGPGAGS
ncbi:MAG: hypothetical protein ACP5QR_05180 [Rhizomicrobium sp.]